MFNDYVSMADTYSKFLMSNPTDSGSSFNELSILRKHLLSVAYCGAIADVNTRVYANLIAHNISTYLRAEGYGL